MADLGQGFQGHVSAAEGPIGGFVNIDGVWGCLARKWLGGSLSQARHGHIAQPAAVSGPLWVIRRTAVRTVPSFFLQRHLVDSPKPLGKLLPSAKVFYIVEHFLEPFGQALFVGILSHGPQLLHVDERAILARSSASQPIAETT